MRCSSCGSENPDGKRFCADCGAELVNRCARCGSENPAGKKFCGDCGAAIGSDSAAPIATAVNLQGTEAGGERRHLTVLFCDLVGSTEIASRLDPEEWREIVAEYHRAAAHSIERYGGHVAQYLGDGVMAYFGYPAAHDNDAERGARAGLAILDAIAELNEQAERPKLAARVGIDSGAVVVGAGASREADVFGDTPNIAARGQAVAEPGTVIITDAAHRLVSGLFVVEERGAQALKGVERLVALYRVVRPSGARGRFEAAAAAGGLTPFVGREDELRSVLSRWRRVRQGEGQVVTIIGEAGIGKSRLVRRFHEQITATPHTWMEAGGGAFFQDTPFYPVSELLRQFLTDGSAHDQIAQLAPRLTAAGLGPADAVPLIAPLLNLPLPPEYPPSLLPPDQQRRRLLATLVEWLLGAARTQPLVSVIEDLHWVDPSTLELIQLLVEQGTNAQLLLLYTARPEFRAGWPLRAHHTQLTLNRLNPRDVRTMVGEVASRKALSDETVATVVERTGGVPLFVEELTRAVLESDEARLRGRAIPATLHDSLMARLDRLGPAKEVIQIGAALGDDFSYALLHAVHPIPELDLQRALRSLTDAELLYVRGIAPEASYQFKHALIRDAAYEALLKTRRKALHRTVARTIDEQFAAIKEAYPEVLARHWAEAGEVDSAIAEWQKAGKHAFERGAYHEAERHYRDALGMLPALPESTDRDALEFDLLSSMLQTIWVTKGFASRESFETNARAKALAEKTGNLPQLVKQTYATWAARFSAGDYASAASLADRLMELAEREGTAGSLAFAHDCQSQTRHRRGDLGGSEQYFSRGRMFFTSPEFASTIGALSSSFGEAALNACTMGYANLARERIRQSIEAAKSNPHSSALAHMFAAYLEATLRDLSRLEIVVGETMKLCERHGLPEVASWTRCPMGWLRAQLGFPAEGVALMKQGLNESAKRGDRVSLTGNLTWLAEAQALAGATGDALATIEEALTANPEERHFRPETLRVRGELRRSLGQDELAEIDFVDSIQLAKQISAKAWELRATMSLARLMRDTHRGTPVRAMLAEIYGWFIEGFDTPDLKDAKALLDELAG
jgi:class 3 adenylate cyclase/tetratricopeptide (TPR) repeat protein